MASEPIEKVHDEFVEVAAFCFTLAGHENASAILNLTKPAHFASFGGAMGDIFHTIAELARSGAELNLVAIKEALAADPKKNLLKKVGGEDGLIKLSKRFPVDDGKVRFGDSGDVVIADAETIARVIVERAGRRRLIRLLDECREGLRRVKGEEDGPGMTYALARERLAVELAQTEEATEYPTKSDADEYDEFAHWLMKVQSGEEAGWATGMPSYDKMTGGLHTNDYLKISATDKMGKSTLGLNLANYLTRKVKLNVLLVSFEMTRDLIRSRRIAMNSEGRLTIGKLLSQQPMSERDLKVALEIWDMLARENNLHILDGTRDIDESVLEVYRVVRAKGVQVVLWDYLQKGEGKAPTDEALWTRFSKSIAGVGQYFSTHGHPLATIVIDQINDQGQKEQKIFGVPRGEHSYGSKQANKDATVKTTLMLEPELWACHCPDQGNKREVFNPKKMAMETVPVPKWEFRPANGVCPDCLAEGRDPHIYSVNPERSGKWFIEGGRNTSGHHMIPLVFNGRFMTMVEDTTDPYARKGGPARATPAPAVVRKAEDNKVASLFDE